MSLSFLRGLYLAKDLGNQGVVIIGVSKTIISHLHKPSQNHSVGVRRIIANIKSLESSFFHLEYVHVLRHLNSQADTLANKESLLSVNF